MTNKGGKEQKTEGKCRGDKRYADIYCICQRHFYGTTPDCTM